MSIENGHASDKENVPPHPPSNSQSKRKKFESQLEIDQRSESQRDIQQRVSHLASTVKKNLPDQINLTKNHDEQKPNPVKDEKHQHDFSFSDKKYEAGSDGFSYIGPKFSVGGKMSVGDANQSMKVNASPINNIQE